MMHSILAPTPLEGAVPQEIDLSSGLLLAAGCLLLLLWVALPRLASWRRGRGHHVLGPAAAESLLLGVGALVVDLREKKAFCMGHIRGCLQVPFSDAATRFKKPDPRATRPIILVDETDRLSHRVYGLLMQRGFSEIYVLKGGMRAWRRANRPLAK